jgi:hypothetical protein
MQYQVNLEKFKSMNKPSIDIHFTIIKNKNIWDVEKLVEHERALGIDLIAYHKL